MCQKLFNKLSYIFDAETLKLMKKTLLILALLGLQNIGQAQDQLYKRDNSRLLVKIIEITPDEIKYKPYDNQGGPIYVIGKNEAVMIIYENGRHEVMSSGYEPFEPQQPMANGRMRRADSLQYFKYQSSLALNFFSFANAELGFIYQREFYKSNFALVIPFGTGVSKPALTQSIYYGDNYGKLKLDHKLFEVGIGLNYYPSLRFPVNYYLGPAIKYMQTACQQVHNYYTPPTAPGMPGKNNTITKNSILTSYCYSITNGFMFRTKSRLVLNLFGSLGFRNDALSNTIIDPVSNMEVTTLRSPVTVYFWGGFAIGYSF